MIKRWWPRLLALLLLVAVVGVLLPGAEHSQVFPRKPLTLLVAYSPGGAVDSIARLLARHLEPELGQRVVVKNLPGAGGQIGYTSLAIAKNDGYQLGFISAPSLAMLKLLRPAANFTLEDFHPLANIQADPVVLVVNAQSPIHSLTEFLQAAKDRPGALTVSGDGPLSNNQLQLAVTEELLQVELNFVPFNGSGPALTALLGGQVEAAVPSSSSAASYVSSGKLRALAVFADKTPASMDAVPTVSEAAGVSVPSIGMALRGVVVPVGVPASRQLLLSAAIKRAVENPEFVAQARAANLPLRYMDQDAFAAYLSRLNEAVDKYLPLLTKEGVQAP